MAEAEHRVTLWVGGHRHEGWKNVAVTLNLDHMAGDFNLSLTDEYLKDGELEKHPIDGGAACRVVIDDETVMTGWVDNPIPAFDDKSNIVTVTGRDATGDLVDCSAEVKEYLNQKLEAVARDMCAPFGIKVVVATDTGAPFKRVAVNTGDTVQTCIERMCRQRGVMAWSDGLGNLVIGRGSVGKPVATLERGKNVLAATAPNNFAGRFSVIIVRGTRETPDASDSTAGSQEQGMARDTAVKRHRPKIMVPETQGSSSISLGERAAHEQRVAQGKSRCVSVTVWGWRHDNGLWRPGQTVAFNDTRLRISGTWLVANVAFVKNDDDGTVTKLNLYPPGAFDLLAQPGEE